MEYAKIETLFNRDDKFKVIVDDFRLKEFELIREWEVSEKIHGTNIRICYEPITEVTGFIGLATMQKVIGRRVNFYGRSEKSEIPKHLLDYLIKTFTLEKFAKAFPPALLGSYATATVFAEGYGHKIQDKGMHYVEGDNVMVRVFDVYVEDYDAKLGGWWLESENIKDVCNKLGVKTVPIFGMWTTEQIVNFVHKGTFTDHAFSVVQREDNEDFKQEINMEGLVAKTKPLMFTRKGERIMFKLKIRDFGK